MMSVHVLPSLLTHNRNRSKSFASRKSCKNGALKRVPYGIINYIHIYTLIPCIEIYKRNTAP